MKKELVVLLILILGISYVNAATTFPASNVSLKIDGVDRTLQYAIDNGLLKGTHTYASASASAIIGQHDASQIWIRVKSGEVSLLDGLKTVDKLVAPTSATNSYTNFKLNPGHMATEIIMANGQTFQKGIDSGSFAGCIPGSKNSCGVNTECKTYSDIECTSAGVWPTCPAPTGVARGTNCGSSNPTHPMGYSMACDGAGECVGYAGTGCAACPFGSTTANSVSSCIYSRTTYISRYYMTVGGWGVDCDDRYTVTPNDCWTNWITTSETGAVCNYHSCGASGAGCTDTAMSWQIKPI